MINYWCFFQNERMPGMDDLVFPIFKDKPVSHNPVSMDEFLSFVLFVNKVLANPLTRKSYEERTLPVIPFRLD